MKRKIKTLTDEQVETIRRESEQWLTDTMAKIKQCEADRQKHIGKEQSIRQHTVPTPSEYYDFLQRKKADRMEAKKLMWHECEKH